ncbi:MAG: hypothetical protein L6416_03560 [Candidatus Omnitrophica bacterium]|nr:hypothetical protein [Candidatus Omnitrophota bacterium]
MKNSKLILIISGMLFAALLSILILEFKINAALKKEWLEKEGSIKAAKKITQEAEKIQKEITDLTIEDSQIEKMVPLNEQEPMGLIKTLSLLANQSKAKNLEIIFLNQGKDSSDTSDQQEQSGTSFSPEDEEDDEFSEQNETFFSLKPQLIQMNFECEFPQVIAFLNKALSLDRIVLIDSVKIERVEKILPRQKVTLMLSAYTFLAE